MGGVIGFPSALFFWAGHVGGRVQVQFAFLIMARSEPDRFCLGARPGSTKEVVKFLFGHSVQVGRCPRFTSHRDGSRKSTGGDFYAALAVTEQGSAKIIQETPIWELTT